MPVQMSYSGLNFDIVTGVTALVLGIVMVVARVPKAVVMAWNVMGLVLLANIVGVAMLSTPVFAVFGPDRLNVWVTWMPYTLLPAVMVLAALAGHLIVFRALAQPARSIQAGSSM
jgi:small-conductance mechanosensitive channel